MEKKSPIQTEEVVSSPGLVVEPKKPSKRRGFVLAISAYILVLVGAVAAYFVLQGGGSVGLPIQLASEKKEIVVVEKTWINCSDVRKIIEEGGKRYVACFGGVLVVDKATGKVTDQISMVEGLGNYVATDLVKKGDVLYIGSQDGFTIFNLKTRVARKISVGEGLVNGANIKLADDDTDLWVATFDGVSRYNYETGKITNYKSELAENSSKHSVWEIKVTSKAIYVSVGASAYSSGGVARFDKESQAWETWNSGDFEGLKFPGRVDVFDIVHLSGKVYVRDGNQVWVADDIKGSTWKWLPVITEEIGKKHPNSAIRSETVLGGKIIFKVEEEHYYFDPSSNKVENIKSDPTLVSDYQKWTDETTLTKLDGRPLKFYEVMGRIGKYIFISGQDGLWAYDQEMDSFENLYPTVETNGYNFSYMIPVEKTSKVLFYFQSCGMGCSNPKMVIVDMSDLSANIVDIESAWARLSEAGVGPKDALERDTLVFDSMAPNSSEIKLNWFTGKKSVFFDILKNEWRIGEEVPEGTFSDMRSIYRCNLDLSYSTQEGIAGVPGEGCESVAQDDLYTYTYVFDQDKPMMTQIDKATGTKKVLTPPLAKPQYTPFEWSYSLTVGAISVVDGKVYLATSRGLTVYDPKKDEWRLFSTLDGLPSDETLNFVVIKNGLVVVTNAGMAIVPRE